jgi:hypothetical protein
LKLPMQRATANNPFSSLPFSGLLAFAFVR